MRILFTTATYLPSINGVAYQIDSLKQELIRQQHQVLIIAPDHHPSPPKDKNVIRYPSISNPFALNYPVGLPLVSESLIRKFSPQIIHTHHPFHIGAFAKTIAAKRNLPLFLTHHSSYEDYVNVYIPFGHYISKKILNHHLKKFSQELCQVICPSPHMQHIIKQIGITNTCLIPNGIETYFKPRSPKNKHLSLIYVGRFSLEKNLLPTLKLLGFLKQIDSTVTLTLIGEGMHLKELSTYALEHNLLNNIHFLGPIKRSFLPQHLSRHHFFVSYSTTESFSLSHLEALACGVPLLIPPQVRLGTFTNSGNSLSIPLNYAHAAKAIYKSFADHKLYAQKVASAIRSAQEFSIQATARSHLQLYQKFLRS